MKKFFTNIPQAPADRLKGYVYAPAGNERLGMDTKTSFPILSAVNGYAEAGEEIRVIAVETREGGGPENLERLRQELAGLCGKTGIRCPCGVETVPPAEGEQVARHVETFRRLIDLVDDGDELFACITYGTKPASMALLAAVRYAYRVKRNTSVPCIVYGHVERVREGDTLRETARVCDETALLQVDEMVRLLADSGVRDPRAALDAVLSL